MKKILVLFPALLALAPTGALNAQSNPRLIPFWDDDSTEISTNKTYTHAVSFGNNGTYANPSVNGEPFHKTTVHNNGSMPSPRQRYGWDNFPSVAHGGGSMDQTRSPSGSGIYGVLFDMKYDLRNGDMKVTGLKPGFVYEIRFYNRPWGNGGDHRWQTFVFKPNGVGNPGHSIEFNQDDTVMKDNMLAYQFRANAAGELFIRVDGINTGPTAGTYHCYGFTNEELDANVTITGTASLSNSGATLDAEFFFAGQNTLVEAHWGFADEEWEDSVAIGTFSDHAAFPVAITGLSDDTKYCVRLSATAAGVTEWSKPFFFTTQGSMPTVSAAPATSVMAATAVANGDLSWHGFGFATADVWVYWSTNNTPGGPLEWGCVPLGPKTMAATGAFDFNLANLLPATEYRYCFLASNSVHGAWSDAALFTTHDVRPELAMLSAASGLTHATVGVRLDWTGESENTAGILFLYGTQDGYDGDADAWLADPATLREFFSGCGVGEHSFLLPVPVSSDPYYCRAFAVNSFGTNAAPSGVMFNSLYASAPGLNPDWVWAGTVSTSWSDWGNWVSAADFATHPAGEGDLQNAKLLLGMGPHLPLNQNVPGLVVNELQVAALTGHLTVTGMPVTLNRFNCGASVGGTFNAVFRNDLELVFGGGAWGTHATCHLHLHGTLSETGGAIVFNSNGTIHFFGPVLFTGGLHGGDTSYYHPRATGGIANPPKHNFYAGNQYFNLPPGMPSHEYDLPVENGVQAGAYIIPAANVTVVVNAPVEGSAMYCVRNGGGNNGGILELNAATNTFTGGFDYHDGFVIVQGGLAPGYPGAQHSTIRDGALDLNGADLLDRSLYFWGRAGVHNDGALRNQNPDRPILVNGYVEVREDNGTVFGGVGDILATGTFDTRANGTFVKTGAGTLTLSGAPVISRATRVAAGALVLDYGENNTPKLAPAATLTLSGTLTLEGNKWADTTQDVGTLAIGMGENLNRARVTPVGRGGHSSTFRFTTFSLHGSAWEAAATVDFAPGTNGHIYTSATANHPNLYFKAISMRATYKGESFARVSGTEVNGYSAIEPVPPGDYLPDFDTVLINDLVDLARDTTYSNNVRVGAIRFNTPAPVTLTLNNEMRILGERPDESHGNTLGAILVTPKVGANNVAVNGPNRIQQGSDCSLIVHQYNTQAPLIFNARVNASTLVKTGPGEIVINHPDTAFNNLYLHEGSLSHKTEGAVGGPYTMLTIGDATLRYEGPGHVSSRQIRVQGFGIVEASGTGPLVLDNATTFHVYGLGNRLLTLSGEGGGIVKGRFDLRGGRVRKRGTGTWTLAEASHSSIIWGMDVMEGTLVLDGSFGRDVSVYDGGTLTGSGRVNRNLIVKDGGMISADPDAGELLDVGKNLIIEKGAKLDVPKKLSADFRPVLKVHGTITGKFEQPNHAYIEYDHANGLVSVRFRPTGTLLMVR